MIEDIRAHWGSSGEHGGCNACYRYFVNGHSPRKHEVLNVHFRSLTFRLCAGCVQLLKEEMRRADVRAGK